MNDGVLRRLTHLLDPSAHDGPGEHVPWTALNALAAVIGCDFLSFQVMNPARQVVSTQCLAPAPASQDGGLQLDAEDDAVDLFWDGLWDCAACSYPLRTADHHTVTRLSDFYGQREFRRTTMGAYASRIGFSREVMLPLPPDGEYDRRVLLFREAGPDFTGRDALLLTLLRPHLYSLHLRQRYRNRGLPALTTRQMEILRMVAAGLSNSQIARALYVSEATVGKHLENIFSRLAVTNRAAAAITWSQLDDLAPQPAGNSQIRGSA
jgi:DNA-binding CsgD family transcriptional regulator